MLTPPPSSSSLTQTNGLIVAGKKYRNYRENQVYVPIDAAFGSRVRGRGPAANEYLRKNPWVIQQADQTCQDLGYQGVQRDTQGRFDYGFTYDGMRVDNVEYPQSAGFTFTCGNR